jgi:hypothetical protein
LWIPTLYIHVWSNILKFENDPIRNYSLLQKQFKLEIRVEWLKVRNNHLIQIYMLVIFHIYSLLSKIYQINQWLKVDCEWASFEAEHIVEYGPYYTWLPLFTDSSLPAIILNDYVSSCARVLQLFAFYFCTNTYTTHVWIVIWFCLLMLFKWFFFCLKKCFDMTYIMKNAARRRFGCGPSYHAHNRRKSLHFCWVS